MNQDNNLPTRTRCRLPGANEGPTRALLRPPPEGTVIIANQSPALLRAELARGRRTGEYGDATQVIRVKTGTYAVKVNRHRPPRPRWRKPALIAGSILAVLLSVAALGWWALASLAAALPGGALGGLCILGLILAAGGTMAKDQIVEVLVKVRVR